MWFEKDGITTEMFHPIDIAKYKRIGWKEIPAPDEVSEKQELMEPVENPETPKTPKKKGGKDA